MRQTLDSVVAQSVRPAEWVIVDDGSTDDTPRILAEYAARHDWIRIVTRADRGHRAVGPGVIDAFYNPATRRPTRRASTSCASSTSTCGCRRATSAILMQRMHADPRIATCSGKAWIEEDGALVDERHGDETSLGMTKFYRVRPLPGDRRLRARGDVGTASTATPAA